MNSMSTMLRKWHPPAAVNLWVVGETPEADPDEIVLWKDEPMKQEPNISEALLGSQQEQLHGLLEEYPDVLQSTPGRTTMIEHTIDMEDRHRMKATYISQLE